MLCSDLDDIPGLEQSGICYYRTGRVPICICCKIAVRPSNVHGHIISKGHWGLLPMVGRSRISKEIVTKALDMFDFIAANEDVTLPAGPIAPFPFLQLFPHDAPRNFRDDAGWYCKGHLPNGEPCLYACRSHHTMEGHIASIHSDEKRSNPYWTAKNLYTKGPVQRFFVHQAGSAFFCVTPILSGVMPDSDFDTWFRSLSDVEREQNLSQAAMMGDNDDGGGVDLSPFLAKVGWVKQLEGFSRISLMKKAIAPSPGENHLRNILAISQRYFRSISQAEVTQSVHPVHLRNLNNWKK